MIWVWMKTEVWTLLVAALAEEASVEVLILMLHNFSLAEALEEAAGSASAMEALAKASPSESAKGSLDTFLSTTPIFTVIYARYQISQFFSCTVQHFYSPC